MHVGSVLNNHLLAVWLSLLRSSVLLFFFLPFYFPFSFLSAERCDKGGGPFPQVYPLCWLNSDVTSAKGRVQYVISFPGSGLTPLLLQVAFDDITQHETPCSGTHAGVGWGGGTLP